MPVRAVTPLVPAARGGVQLYRDADFHDRAQDERATGEDIYSPEWPDQPIELGRSQASSRPGTHCPGTPGAADRGVDPSGRRRTSFPGGAHPPFEDESARAVRPGRS